MDEMTSALPETGPQLRELRNEAGLSAREVAARLGTYEVKVTRWERELDRIPEGGAAKYRRAVIELSAAKAKAARERCRKARATV